MGNGGVYTTATTVPIDDKMMPKEPGAINGGFTGRGKETPYPVITIGVDSIDDTLKKVEAGGGSTITPRTPIPNMGAFAYFKDSEGNTMGLYESAMYLRSWGLRRFDGVADQRCNCGCVLEALATAR